MGLEVVTHLSDLVITNPVGAVDPKSQGDDHIRNIKKALRADFVNISGVVTASHTELGYVTGVTSAIQTQLNAKAASAHNHSAADLTSGTVPDARFPATLPALNGSLLTALNATQLTTGAVADARLSANVPLKNATNTFSVKQTISSGASSAALDLDATGGAYQNFYKAGVAFAAAGSAEALGGAVGSYGLYVGGALRYELSSTVHDFKAGTITTANTSAAEVGYKGMPVSITSVDYTLVLTDAGKYIIENGSPAKTVTIPANGSVAFPIGTTIVIENGSTTITQNIAITTDTLYLVGTAFATTGTRTLAPGCVATLFKRTATTWTISGGGVG